MLQIDAAGPNTISLLQDLMSTRILKDFSLAGGTGLALRMGHRISVDLDLFCTKDFTPEQILQELQSDFNIQINNISKNTLNLIINEIKVDVLSYKYPLLKEIEIEQGIRMFSVEDISAMKLSAVSSRGSKKDFYDLYFILKIYSLSQLFEFYKKKYQTDQYYYVLKSLIYFEDAELEPDVQLTKTMHSWNDVKRFFEKTVKEFINQP